MNNSTSSLTHTCDARCQLERRASFLSYFTVAYNIVEGVVVVAAGLATNTVSLVGFGVDSFVESLSGGIMIWRFARHGQTSSAGKEDTAIWLVSASLAILGSYVFYESVSKLISGEGNEQSAVGLVVLVLSLIIMPSLYLAKKRVARDLHSHSLMADNKQTLACTMMSAVTLVGLGVDYFYQIRWIDPVLGIGIAAYLIYEAFQTYREKKLCAC